MESAIRKLVFAIVLFRTLNSYGQPDDLTHPAHQNKSKTVAYSLYSIPEGIKPIIIYDGVTLFNTSSLKTINKSTVNSVKKSQDTLLDNSNEQGFNAILEITTLDEVNPGLKYIKEKTKYWIKEHPLAVFYLNGVALLNDQEKLAKLTALEINAIKEIKILNPREGEELFGKIGENGLIVITLN